MAFAQKNIGFALLQVAVLSGMVACSGSDDTSNPGTGTVGGTLGAGGQAATVGGSVAVAGNSSVVPSSGGSSATTATAGAAGSLIGAGGSVTTTTTTTPVAGATSAGGATSTAGGAATKGGATSAGGSTAKGGASAAGGTTAKGGATSAGGATTVGGTTAKGGATSAGGATTAGGTTAKGGSSSVGGATTAGGTTAKGGSTSVGGAATTGGSGNCTIPAISNTPVGYGKGVTGGGNATPVTVSNMTEFAAAVAAYKKGTSGLVIKYTGTFDFTSIAANPCGQFTKDEQTVDLKDMSNVTIIGAPGSALNFGLHFMRVNNIIIRNMKFGYIPGAGDAIGIEGSSYDFWIDHNEFFSSMVECTGAGDGEFDGLLDIKDGSYNMTFSYNYFHDHHKVGLMGSSDTDTNDWKVTMHHNRYENVGSRLPLQRGGTTHIYNNYYNNVMVTGINVRMGGISLVESNYFENSKNPVTSRDSDAIGYWDVRNNYVGTGITWTTASAPSANGDSWTATKAFTASLGYSYTPDQASCVKAIDVALAGQKLP